MSTTPARLLALLAILLISVFVAACGDDEGDDEAGTTATDEATETDDADGGDEMAMEGSEEVTVQLDEQSGSGVTGEATLMAEGDSETRVTVELQGGEEGTPHPIHVHAGTCEELGAVEYPLDNVEDGMSETTIDVGMQELLDGEYVINAHESEENIQNYVACGPIEGSAPA